LQQSEQTGHREQLQGRSICIQDSVKTAVLADTQLPMQLQAVRAVTIIKGLVVRRTLYKNIVHNVIHVYH